MGSVPTPYIFDDRCDWNDVADRVKDWYDVGREERKRCGMVGHEWAIGDDSMMSGESMCNNFIEHMDKVFETWKPRKRFSVYKV